jgi:heme/copper-type cytochrome/quinol oxidase subunit 4
MVTGGANLVANLVVKLPFPGIMFLERKKEKGPNMFELLIAVLLVVAGVVISAAITDEQDMNR